MILIVIFIISIVGLIFFTHLSRRNDSKNLLHNIKKSCNIDSVRFEKHLLFLKYFIKNNILKFLSKSKKTFYKLIHHKEKGIRVVKKTIRKKLYNQDNKTKVSEFMSKLK